MEASSVPARDERIAYIDPTDAYVYEAWHKALQPLGINVVSDKAVTKPVLFWYEDYDKYDFDRRDSFAQWVYSYVFRKALTRKNHLGHTILQYRAKRPGSILHRAWPDSFDLEIDFPEFLDDALDESWDLRQEIDAGAKTWILKPALGERAHGIRLFKTQEDLQQIFDEQLAGAEEEEANEMREYVVQEYIRNPLLVDGRKFHLRVYVLCVGKLRVYVHSHVLALFSGSDYDGSNLDSLQGHLTNTCFQGEQAKVSQLSEVLPAESAATVFDDICAITHDLFEAAQGNPINFQALPNALEFFGLDFIVDADLGVHVLEVNAYPDFKQTGSDLRRVVDTLFVDTAKIVFAGEPPQDLRLVLEQ